MSGIDWTTVRKLVEAAREIPPTSRSDFLKEQCGDRPDLLAEVSSLLKHEVRAEEFLEPPATAELAPLIREHHAASYVGRKIGPFEILGLLGYGGMGLVLRAQQSNPPREVALKIVRGGNFVDERQLRLFEREIRSLARLAHPAIASLYEAGCTEDGQHYFAMELVEGEPITVFAERKNLSTSQKLSLFQKLCRAIHYAHQRGVIHRDLKPNNVLVTANETVKVLDFGLAKITDADLTVTSIAALGNKVEGTIAYMSPEQARGAIEEIDVRSDVYSLGIVLYELLTGRMPYDSGANLPEIVRQVCQDPPIRPGSVTRSLRGDLETIILKAIEKVPGRRYQSADALADDIQRFLNKQPIAARPPSAAYQIRKMVVRHKFTFLFASAFLLLIVGSAVVAITLSIQLAHERDRALAATQKASTANQSSEEIIDFLVKLFEKGNPSLSDRDVPTVLDLVDNGATHVTTELTSQPLVQARLMNTLGRVYISLTRYDRARELLEYSYTIRSRELGPEHEEVAESLMGLSRLYVQTMEGKRALELAMQALEIRRRQFGEIHARFAASLDWIGNIYFYENDFKSAEAYLRQCLDVRLKLYGEQNLEVASSLQNLGQALCSQQKIDEAEQVLQRALAIKRNLNASPTTIVQAMEALAHVPFARHDDLETERLLKEQVDYAKANLHRGHFWVNRSLSSYATVIMNNRGAQDADPIYREALAIARESNGDVIRRVLELAYVRKQLKDFDEAALLYSEALSLRKARLGNSHYLIGETSRELGLVLSEARRFDEAEPALLESFAVYVSALGEDHAKTARAAQDLALLYERWDRPDEVSKWQEILTARISQ